MIVIDTHVWIWWVDLHPRLRADVKAMIDAEADVRVSAISLWEIALAASLNRLSLLPDARRPTPAAGSRSPSGRHRSTSNR